MNLQKIAARNFRRLQKNDYPGRWMILGLDEPGENLVEIYGLTGRSEESQNRLFREKNGHLFIEKAKKSRGKKMDKNRFYSPMKELRNCFIVTNGRQTDTIIEALYSRHDSLSLAFQEALEHWEYEDDSIGTTRINGYSSRSQNPMVELSIIRKSETDESVERASFRWDSVPKGFGYFISTYRGDGDPPPPFDEAPWLMPLKGVQKKICKCYWGALGKKNRVAIAVKFIPLKAGSKSKTVYKNKREPRKSRR